MRDITDLYAQGTRARSAQVPSAYKVVTSRIHVITNLFPIARWLLDAKHSVAKRQQLHHLVAMDLDIISEQVCLREY